MRLRSLIRRTFRRYWFDPAGARYHFIHIPKNAGEAVRDALYFQRDVSLSSPFHYRYVDIASRAGVHLQYFAAVRNPWSRTASRYQFGRQNAAKWAADDPRRIYMERATFSDFVKDRLILPIPEHPGQPWMGPLSSWFNQLEWIRDQNGNVACDALRMESLSYDLPLYLGRPLKLRERNVTKAHYDYRKMYNAELAEIVATEFHQDIAHFGFTFEGAATKNVFDGSEDSRMRRLVARSSRT